MGGLQVGRRRRGEQVDDALRAEGLRGRCLQLDVAAAGLSFEVPAGAHLTLVNNAAAPFVPKPLHLLGWDELDRHLNVSLRGSLQASLCVLRPMVTAGYGTIVNVLSTTIDDVPKGFTAYAVAKQAELALTRGLATEYGRRGVRVFAVAPGYMETAMTAAWPPALREAVARADGVNDPIELARQVVALVGRSDLPATGEVYRIRARG